MKKLLMMVALAAVSGGAAVAAAPVSAAASETHSNCVTFDDQGNILSATPNCSETMVFKGGSDSQTGQNPCNGETGTFSLSYDHQQFHVNVNGDGEIWVTGNANGVAGFAPDDASLPALSGPFSSWFGGQLNNRNMGMEDTFSVQLTDAAGEHVGEHVVDHMTITPNGVLHSFSVDRFTCG